MSDNDLRKSIANAAVFTGSPLSKTALYQSGENRYTGRAFPYFEDDSDRFIWENAKYAANVYKATVQGIIGRPFYETRGVRIRSMDIVEQSTGTQFPNDWQSIYFEDSRIRGLHSGAKIWYAGNTWISTAPYTIDSGTGHAVIRKCNAFFNTLDYYGNVVTEPFVWSKAAANATANEHIDYTVIAHNYNKCVMQLNENTKDILVNRRMILGKSAFQVTGIVDFVSDFSDTREDGQAETEEQRESRIMYFDLYYTEPLETDDMERHIAGGKTFKWDILPGYSSTMESGTTQTITATTIRNGEQIESTEEHPFTYRFESTDTNVLTVDDDGKVTAVSDGNAEIRVTLSENRDIYTVIQISVGGENLTPETTLYPGPTIFPSADTGYEIVFDKGIPNSLKQTQEYETRIKLYADGNEHDEVAFEIESAGPEKWCYDAFIEDGNILHIKCYESSEKPLRIKIKCLYADIEKEIRLRGYF